MCERRESEIVVVFFHFSLRNDLSRRTLERRRQKYFLPQSDSLLHISWAIEMWKAQAHFRPLDLHHLPVFLTLWTLHCLSLLLLDSDYLNLMELLYSTQPRNAVIRLLGCQSTLPLVFGHPYGLLDIHSARCDRRPDLASSARNDFFAFELLAVANNRAVKVLLGLGGRVEHFTGDVVVLHHR